MKELCVVFVFCAFIALCVWLIKLPIKIAKNRNIKGNILNTIKVLSWLGIFLVFTWIVALIMALCVEQE